MKYVFGLSLNKGLRKEKKDFEFDFLDFAIYNICNIFLKGKIKGN
tara:strand:+ start:941 stop:1075 length:135 start_codon:yes stop_codon:yes gene_type:complete